MRRTPSRLIAVTVFLLAAPVLADEAAPTLESAREHYTNGHYKDTLNDISAIQQYTGKAAEGLDRFALFMLKGETQLRLRDQASALSAFSLAHKEATTPDQKDQALAIEDLVRRSAIGIYHPKLNADGSDYTDSKVFEITDAQARKEAFAALLIDEMTPFYKSYEFVKSSGTLPQINDFLRLLPTMHAVEKTATGKNEKCDLIVSTLRDRSLALIDTALDANEKPMAAIKADVLKIIQVQVDVTDPRTNKITKKMIQRYAGPTTAQAGTLKGLAIACEKLTAQVTDLKDDLQFTPEMLKTRVPRNDKLYLTIQNLLTFDFTKPVAKNAAPPNFTIKQGG